MQVAVSEAVERSPRHERNARLVHSTGSSLSKAKGVLREVRPLADVDAAKARIISEDVVPRDRSEMICRVANVTIATLAVICLAPLLAAVALLVRITSSGPVIYSQVRVGVDRRYNRKSSYDRRAYDHGGKPFTIFKFRTMRVDAEADGRAVWASTSDPRVTSVGSLLRRTRLDELPQLLNVIRGDMNIVGPRPERPAIFADLRQSIPQYPMRQRVKPGITGWAQINLAYDACVDDVRRKVELDLDYMKRQSLLHDLQIMTMTLPVMIFRRGSL